MMRKLLIVLVLMVAAGGTALLATNFGDETLGGQNDVSYEGIINCSKATPSSSGTATNIFWYSTNSTSTKLSKAAVYTWVDDTQTGITTKIAESGEITAAVDAAWRTSTISFAVTSGTPVYLCGWSAAGTGSNFMNHATTGGISAQDTVGYAAWPAPFAADVANGTRSISIYVTYTETSTGTTRTIGGGLIE